MGLCFGIWFSMGLDKEKAKKRYTEFFQNLPSVIPGWEKSCFFDDEGFRIKLVPFEEDVYGSWDDRMTIHASAMTVQFGEEASNKSEPLLNSVTEGEEGCEPLVLRNSEIAVCIQHALIEEDGEPLFQTRLFAALKDELLLMSLYYPDAADRGRAAEVCASIIKKEGILQ